MARRGRRLLAGGTALLVALGVFLALRRGGWAGESEGGGGAAVATPDPLDPADPVDPARADGSTPAVGLRSAAAAGQVGERAPTPAVPWELVVQVTRRPADREAPPGPVRARVRLVYVGGVEWRVLGDVTSGADGVAVLDLGPLRSLPPLALSPNVRILATAERSQPAQECVWLPWSAVLTPPEGEARVLRSIELREARCVRGRVVDGWGRPASGAGVDVDGEGSGRFEATTDAEGRYEHAGIAAAGETFRVVASHPSYGIAFSQPVGSGGTTEIELPDLVLASDAVLEGDVVWSDGSPAAGVRVDAARAADPESMDVPGSRARTDAQGHFRLPATAGTTYHVSLDEVATWGIGGDRAPTQDGVGGGPPLRFVLDTYRIRVRVLDAEGRPLPTMRVLARRIPRERAGELAMGKAGDLPVPTSGVFEPTTTGLDARTELLVAAGVSILLSAGPSPDFISEVAVEGLAAGGERAVDLMLRSPSARGTIRVDLRGLDGVKRPPVWYALATIGGEVLARGYLDAQGRIPGLLPAGLWGLSLIPISARRAAEPFDPFSAADPATGDVDSTCFRWGSGVRIHTGVETIVVADIRRGGRLRIRVADGPGDLGATEVFARRKGTDVELPLRRFARQAIAGEGDFWIGNGLARPQVTTEDLLEPGEYVLRFRPGDEGTPQDLPVVIRPDEVTDLTYTPR